MKLIQLQLKINYDDEIQSSENNEFSDLSVEQQTVEQIENNMATLVEDKILRTNEVKSQAWDKKWCN